MTTATRSVPVVVIGAGPVGLFQLFELGLQGFSQVPIIDTLPYTGGQCVELYPDKPIYDIPAAPCVTGRQLIDNLELQVKNFNPEYVLGATVEHCVRDSTTGEWAVCLNDGRAFLAKAVIIAAGNGSFTPNRLPADIEAALGERLHYRVTDQNAFADQHLVVLGGGDSALDWANNFAATAASVTLVARSDRFRAAQHSVAAYRELVAQELAAILIGQVTGAENTMRGAECPIRLRVAGGGITRTLDCDHVLCFYGLNPKLGPIANWGLEVHSNRLVAKASDSTYAAIVQHSGGKVADGAFVIGDMGIYPNKQKLILTGFHEAANVAVEVYKIVHGHAPTFAYTTTSPVAHQRLGVSPDLSE